MLHLRMRNRKKVSHPIVRLTTSAEGMASPRTARKYASFLRCVDRGAFGRPHSARYDFDDVSFLRLLPECQPQPSSRRSKVRASLAVVERTASEIGRSRNPER